MTVVAGAINRDGSIFMGCDAVSVQDGCLRLSLQPKVFRKGEFLIGSTGTVRIRQIAQYIFRAPAIKPDLDAYMVLFANELRAVMKDHGGESEDEDDKTLRLSGAFLVGVRGRLFEIDSNYGVIASSLPFYAVGSGGQDAMAAMFTARCLISKLSAEDLVNRGLLAAAEFDSSIRPPFTILKLPKWKRKPKK